MSGSNFTEETRKHSFPSVVPGPKSPVPLGLRKPYFKYINFEMTELQVESAFATCVCYPKDPCGVRLEINFAKIAKQITDSCQILDI